ncbi:hypothetical protein LTR78_002400 [Recurvomyces mirabilis]|uniref:Uncharacterized protein n=1 Tax=Recurvomyces mirabilis TaxID=574656 RepID=A0AAE1C467_9PEZI|nr:hypothetical protein LTR78_002400 [Recurvomyces mirabilis]KAK5157329.1 hypothetical protein LTS14_004094 [Recurvomyces mirabilis]
MELEALIAAALNQSHDGEEAVSMLVQLAEQSYQKHGTYALSDIWIQRLLPNHQMLTPPGTLLPLSPENQISGARTATTGPLYTHQSRFLQSNDITPFEQARKGLTADSVGDNGGPPAIDFDRLKSLFDFSTIEPHFTSTKSDRPQKQQDRLQKPPTEPFGRSMLRSASLGNPRTHLDLLERDGLVLQRPLQLQAGRDAAIDAIFEAAPHSLLLKWPLQDQDIIEL